MAEKRPHEDDNALQNGSKRARSNEPSPAPNGQPGKNIQEQMAAIRARAAATREKHNIAKPASPSPAPPTTQNPAEGARAKIEAMRARVAAATSKADQGVPQRTASPLPPPPPQDFDDGSSRGARGGLGTALHPALITESGQDRQRSKGPIPTRFGTTMGNRRPSSPAATAPKKHFDLTAPTLEELKKDPYFDPSVAAAPSRGRKSRDLLFHQKGKFIAQATALRRQAQLEDMKRRIAENTKKAGLDEDKSEKQFLVQDPPAVEWWDEGLLDDPTKGYPDFPTDDMTAESHCKITTTDTVITRYIQHPVLLPPPQDARIPAPKPMFMTPEERAKKRRQDRMEVRKEKQAKVRLGLEPPEPPKVKKSNLMRVLGEQAVKDPTAVEARVNAEIAARAQKHEDTNESRKLTEEQRLSKLGEKQAKDAAKGIICAVFRIDSLAYGKHRYLIDVNAKQRDITGTVILHPRCNLVVVEGGQHDVRGYKKLMLQRVRWTDIEVPTESALQNEREHHPDVAAKDWLQATTGSSGGGEELRDHSSNRCILIWEGELKERSFRKWGSRVCETDAEARRALERNKMEGMWQVARGWNG